MFKLEMKTKNAAFEECGVNPEVARILRAVGKACEAGQTGGTCRDANGNMVGTWSLKS